MWCDCIMVQLSREQEHYHLLPAEVCEHLLECWYAWFERLPAAKIMAWVWPVGHLLTGWKMHEISLAAVLYQRRHSIPSSATLDELH